MSDFDYRKQLLKVMQNAAVKQGKWEASQKRRDVIAKRVHQWLKTPEMRDALATMKPGNSLEFTIPALGLCLAVLKSAQDRVDLIKNGTLLLGALNYSEWALLATPHESALPETDLGWLDEQLNTIEHAFALFKIPDAEAA
jgi:hypothetical protein